MLFRQVHGCLVFHVIYIGKGKLLLYEDEEKITEEKRVNMEYPPGFVP